MQEQDTSEPTSIQYGLGVSIGHLIINAMEAGATCHQVISTLENSLRITRNNMELGIDLTGARRVKAPAKEGFFWGRWHTPAPGTADGSHGFGLKWEVHRVVRAHYRADDEERWMVMVPGVEKWQPLSAFEWGQEAVQ